MWRMARIIINSFVFVLLLLIAYMIWSSSPLLAFLLVLAAIDQFEDVYYYTYRKRLFPMWFMPIDVMFEMVVVVIGLGILVFSLIYYAYFETWFFRAMMLLSIPIIYSAIEDVVLWRRAFSSTNLHVVMHYVCKEKEVREEKRFVRRKQ